ncbi:unnamed protein product [Brugia pahangi]|uniref:Secreted protein n=1 Tax=Brugia pahangi TaxID=6280 RepID=A0A0N4SWS2_BRUPA|nr:unnamed protein product [Brugia pahangi]
MIGQCRFFIQLVASVLSVVLKRSALIIALLIMSVIKLRILQINFDNFVGPLFSKMVHSTESILVYHRDLGYTCFGAK